MPRPSHYTTANICSPNKFSSRWNNAIFFLPLREVQTKEISLRESNSVDDEKDGSMMLMTVVRVDICFSLGHVHSNAKYFPQWSKMIWSDGCYAPIVWLMISNDNVDDVLSSSSTRFYSWQMRRLLASIRSYAREKLKLLFLLFLLRSIIYAAIVFQ